MACLICTEHGPALCTETCRRAASRELDGNLAALRAMPADSGDGHRYELAERNGQLTSALLMWRPADAEGDHAGDRPVRCLE